MGIILMTDVVGLLTHISALFPVCTRLYSLASFVIGSNHMKSYRQQIVRSNKYYGLASKIPLLVYSIYCFLVAVKIEMMSKVTLETTKVAEPLLPCTVNDCRIVVSYPLIHPSSTVSGSLNTLPLCLNITNLWSCLHRTQSSPTNIVKIIIPIRITSILHIIVNTHYC